MGIVITPKLLADTYRIRPDLADRWAPHMAAAARLASVDTEKRVVHFLAQIGHESGRLRFTSELWGPTAQQVRYERRLDLPWPASPAQARGAAFRGNRLAYTLGNSEPGDGSRYRGHGLIQTTGRHNHRRTTDWLRKWWSDEAPDFEENPQLLAQPLWAALSAAAYWRANNLNVHADADDIVAGTRAINGGLNGLADRQALRAAALIALARA